MTKSTDYQIILTSMTDWDAFIKKNSNLPGPRSNLELLHAVAQSGEETFFYHCLEVPLESIPENTPEEFLLMCGIVGLGQMLVKGQHTPLVILRRYASALYWRIRESVCMALQYYGKSDMPALLQEMQAWSNGNPFEQRAAIAALCEPALLHDPAVAIATLQILDKVTSHLAGLPDQRSDDIRVLKKGLAYCWSVAIVAGPEKGKEMLEKWLASPDAGVRWVMKQNLRKNRLVKMDVAWVSSCKQRIGGR